MYILNGTTGNDFLGIVLLLVVGERLSVNVCTRPMITLR